jgi:anti-sigma factor ChrR (cupin superfamily)
VNRLVARLVDLASGPNAWGTLRAGVEMRVLAGGRDGGATVALLRYSPGATVPAHHHPGFEVIYVISGEQTDERGSYPAGTLVVNPPGLGHTVQSAGGCVVLILWERPVEFD